MKRLHNRPRYDTLQTEVRINKGSVGRWVYLILVFALFFWLFNIFVGPKLFFRAEGLVAQDRQVVAVSYTAEIKELRVKDAARVERGTVLALVRSPEMEESIARLSIDFSELRIREAQLNTRMGVLQAVRQVADDRARGMSSLRKNLESLYQRQLATAAQFSASLEDEYEGVFDRERIVAEHQSTQQEINKLQTVLKQSAAALAAIKNTYSAGVITAPIEGLVSGINVASGSVVRAGDPLLEIFTGPKYVIAYATPGALEAIVVGQDVTVEYGVKTLVGKIADVLPISAALPLEFQRSFRPKERAQLIRIELAKQQSSQQDEKVEVPIFTKVKIYKRRAFWATLAELFLRDNTPASEAISS